jgi:hypothetical protein
VTFRTLLSRRSNFSRVSPLLFINNKKLISIPTELFISEEFYSSLVLEGESNRPRKPFCEDSAHVKTCENLVSSD